MANEQSNLIRFWRSRRYWADCLNFLTDSSLNIPFSQRFSIIKRLYAITFATENIPHSQKQILEFVRAILRAPRNDNGVIVEAGCFRGISSAKFSIAAKCAGKQFYVCDSFEGLPANDEPHDKGVFGRPIEFNEGDYAATLDEVQANIERFGEIDVCHFVKGWFSDTLPLFDKPVSALYLDVDLVSSTSDCLRHLWPLMVPGAKVISQDGHIPLVVDLFHDAKFWRDEVGCSTMPEIIYHKNLCLLEATKQ